MASNDFIITSMLSDDFKFEISLGNITQETEHLFKGKLTKICFTKFSIT
jgi:hypothetical protein